MSTEHRRDAYLSDHSRQWRQNLYVYPVVSRRARGLSVGVNLNPDRRCNFGCVYCQVDRTSAPAVLEVDLDRLGRELDATVELAVRGELWRDPLFADVPESMRRINDIAFSGDGEPTSSPLFAPAVALAAQVRQRHGLADARIVVISNATTFHTENFRRAIGLLEANNGEVWAKLDAGTEEYYRRVNRSGVPFERVLDNIEWLARTMPIVIQTLLLRLDGQGPGTAEVQAYVQRLRHIVDAGGQIRLVQLHTIARPPAEPSATALDAAELQAIASRIRQAVPEVPVEVYPGRTPA